MSRVYLEETGDVSLKRASVLLGGIPGGVYAAVGAALKRSARHGLTVGMGIVSEEYAIGQNELKRNTKSRYAITKDGLGAYEVTIGYAGHVIPLIRFDTSVGRDGRVKARVLRGGTRKSIDHAFKQKSGLYHRIGHKRYPIEPLYGPSAAQAFYSRKDATDKMREVVVQNFNERLEHEIDRVLNGGGS